MVARLCLSISFWKRRGEAGECQFGSLGSDFCCVVVSVGPRSGDSKGHRDLLTLLPSPEALMMRGNLGYPLGWVEDLLFPMLGLREASSRLSRPCLLPLGQLLVFLALELKWLDIFPKFNSNYEPRTEA